MSITVGKGMSAGSPIAARTAATLAMNDMLRCVQYCTCFVPLHRGGTQLQDPKIGKDCWTHVTPWVLGYPQCHFPLYRRTPQLAYCLKHPPQSPYTCILAHSYCKPPQTAWLTLMGSARTFRHFIFRWLDLLVSERSVCEPSFLWVADVPYQASTLQLEQLVIMVFRQINYERRPRRAQSCTRQIDQEPNTAGKGPC